MTFDPALFTGSHTAGATGELTWAASVDLALLALLNGASTAFKTPSGVYSPSTNQQSAGSASIIAVASGSMTAVPFRVAQTQTFDRLAINVGSALVGGTTVAIRGGIYNDVGYGAGPSTLLMDAGSNFALTGVAVDPITISQQLTPGLYWLAAAFTYAVAPTTLSVYTLGGGAPGLAGGTFTNNYRGYLTTGVAAGALPSTFGTFSGAVSNVIAMGLRAV